MSVASRLGLPEQDPKVPYISSRVAATLGSVAKSGRIRPAGMVDSCRSLWEIAI